MVNIGYIKKNLKLEFEVRNEWTDTKQFTSNLQCCCVNCVVVFQNIFKYFNTFVKLLKISLQFTSSPTLTHSINKQSEGFVCLQYEFATIIISTAIAFVETVSLFKHLLNGITFLVDVGFIGHGTSPHNLEHLQAGNSL